MEISIYHDQEDYRDQFDRGEAHLNSQVIKRYSTLKKAVSYLVSEELEDLKNQGSKYCLEIEELE